MKVRDIPIAFEVRAEVRRNTRFSLTQKKAYMRVPYGLPPKDLLVSRQEFVTWLESAVGKRPVLADAHRALVFQDGSIYRLGNHAFRIRLSESQMQGASAKTLGKAGADGTVPLSLKLPVGIDDKQRGELIEKLLYKVAGRRAHAGISHQLAGLNAAHFRVPVTRLKLSPTRTRWGSCSTTGTISISSRLLGAPDRCLTAVLVHELAHRIEMNHSTRFWNLVYKAMPDYDEADAWLKENGGKVGWEVV